MTTPASLAKRFQDHLNCTKDHIVQRIQAVFESFDTDTIAKRATRSWARRNPHLFCGLVLVVTFADDTDVIVRLAKSCHNTPPSEEVARLVFESEVATLKYLKANTSIPVPEVYYSNSDPKEVGARYMIIERINGLPLEHDWDSMSHDQQQDIVTQWAAMQAELFKRPFNEIGSLTTEAGAVGPLMPSCLTEYTLRKPHWGPFDSSLGLLAGHVSSVLDGLEENAENRNFFERLLGAIRALPADKFHNECFVLFHDDLSRGNILFARPSKIVGVIDWQGSSILPVWATFQHNDFLTGTAEEAVLRQTLRAITEDTPLPPPLDPVLRELLSLVTGVEGQGLGKLRACFAELTGPFAWLSEPFLSLMGE
ncbi:kinase-like domain-containing protein [Mycena sp. CBHHK59/15]|nr:kinase-like domain-containing protein [Mycena sp. CBHHK59/15]